MIPGEILPASGDIEINVDAARVTIEVANTGDRPIQVGSHYHFFETNAALRFDRAKARGQRLDIPSGTAVRFEPGQRRDIEATARTDGSGLTTVRIQLTTTSHRPVGRPWSFDIRSTQIGLAIWIVMGIGGAILFGAAARRIYVRIRSGAMQTREEPQL